MAGAKKPKKYRRNLKKNLKNLSTQVSERRKVKKINLASILSFLFTFCPSKFRVLFTPGQEYNLAIFTILIWVLPIHNNRLLRERGMASNPKMEYQVFLCIFQKNSAMAILGLKEMGKFLWEGRENGLPCFAKLRQPTRQTFFSTFPKEISHFLQT